MTRVLVVDDDQATSQLLADILVDAGYVVEVAPNGAVAFDNLPHHQPDVVLVDLRMPVMDGVAFTRACRQDPRWSALRIVLLSALCDQPPPNHCFDGFVAKPFDLTELLRIIQLVVGGAALDKPNLQN